MNLSLSSSGFILKDYKQQIARNSNWIFQHNFDALYL